MFPSAKGRETLIDRTRIPADSYIIENAFENLIRWDPMQCVKRLSWFDSAQMLGYGRSVTII